MSDSLEQPGCESRAPADRVAHRPWRAWGIVIAYAIGLGVAVGSIWTIDRHVMKVAAQSAKEEGL